MQTNPGYLATIGLVPFHGPDVVAAHPADLDGNLSLSMNGIPNHLLIAQINSFQQDRGGCDLILLAFQSNLSQGNSFARQI